MLNETITHGGDVMARRLKGTVTLNACVDYKQLAEIIVWAKENQMPFQSRSGVIREVIAIFHMMLENNNQIPVKLTDDMIEIVLAEIGIPFPKEKESRIKKAADAITSFQYSDPDMYLKYQRATKIIETMPERSYTCEPGQAETLRDKVHSSNFRPKEDEVPVEPVEFDPENPEEETGVFTQEQRDKAGKFDLSLLMSLKPEGA
jgi:hypothetical protein